MTQSTIVSSQKGPMTARDINGYLAARIVVSFASRQILRFGLLNNNNFMLNHPTKHKVFLGTKLDNKFCIKDMMTVRPPYEYCWLADSDFCYLLACVLEAIYVSLSLYTYIYIYIYTLYYIYIYIHIYISLSISLSLYIYIVLYIYIYIYIHISLSIYLSLSLSIYLSIYLSLSLYIYIYIHICI